MTEAPGQAVEGEQVWLQVTVGNRLNRAADLAGTGVSVGVSVGAFTGVGVSVGALAAGSDKAELSDWLAFGWVEPKAVVNTANNKTTTLP